MNFSIQNLPLKSHSPSLLSSFIPPPPLPLPPFTFLKPQLILNTTLPPFLPPSLTPLPSLPRTLTRLHIIPIFLTTDVIKSSDPIKVRGFCLAYRGGVVAVHSGENVIDWQRLRPRCLTLEMNKYVSNILKNV